ncbi:MAG: OpgC domain-containing protein [Candidatus Manganitrophus sp.]|nr:OpgC domain-containing protein [Candidatus Manganitrophus sp.]
MMKRENAFDALRGLFLVVMALNHDGGPLSRFTHESFGFVSAAEGFIFLSGFATGWAYAVPAGPSSPSLAQRAFQKARRIYLYQVVSSLFVLTLVRLFPVQAAESRWFDLLLIVHEEPLVAVLLGRRRFFTGRPFSISSRCTLF